MQKKKASESRNKTIKHTLWMPSPMQHAWVQKIKAWSHVVPSGGCCSLTSCLCSRPRKGTRRWPPNAALFNFFAPFSAHVTKAAGIVECNEIGDMDYFAPRKFVTGHIRVARLPALFIRLLNRHLFYMLMRHGTHMKWAATSLFLRYVDVFVVETSVKTVLGCMSPRAAAERAGVVVSDDPGSAIKLFDSGRSPDKITGRLPRALHFQLDQGGRWN